MLHTHSNEEIWKIGGALLGGRKTMSSNMGLCLIYSNTKSCKKPIGVWVGVKRQSGKVKLG